MKTALARLPLRSLSFRALPAFKLGSPAWLRRLRGLAGVAGMGAATGSITAVVGGERQLAARVRWAAPSERPQLVAAAVGDAQAAAAWKAEGLFKGSQPLLVLRCSERHLLTLDQPQVEASELAMAVRWPLAEALECEPEGLLASALPMPRINDSQRSPVLAIGAHIEPVREVLAALTRAGVAVRAIDIIDSAVRGMALLHTCSGSGTRTSAPYSGVALISVGREVCIGLLQEGQLCALRTLPLPAQAPRDAAGFEEHLALHIQRTTDTFERQATQLAVRHVLALLPNIGEAHRDEVRAMLPLEARWLAAQDAFDISPEAAAALQAAGDEQDTLLALACVAAARLHDSWHHGAPGGSPNGARQP